MSEGNGKRPTHFDYEAVVAWERQLRAKGIFAKIGRTYRGHDIVHLEVQLSLNPGDPLPDFDTTRKP